MKAYLRAYPSQQQSCSWIWMYELPGSTNWFFDRFGKKSEPGEDRHYNFLFYFVYKHSQQLHSIKMSDDCISKAMKFTSIVTKYLKWMMKCKGVPKQGNQNLSRILRTPPFVWLKISETCKHLPLFPLFSWLDNASPLWPTARMALNALLHEWS